MQIFDVLFGLCKIDRKQQTNKKQNKNCEYKARNIYIKIWNAIIGLM